MPHSVDRKLIENTTDSWRVLQAKCGDGWSASSRQDRLEWHPQCHAGRRPASESQRSLHAQRNGTAGHECSQLYASWVPVSTDNQ